MPSTISSISSSADLSKLAPTFQTAIKDMIDAESQPMKRVQSQKDELDVRKGIYTDMKSNLDGLQSALHALMTGQTDYALKSIAKMTLTPGIAGAAVLTATTTDTAAFADYNIYVSQLAKAQSRATTAYASPDVPLGKTGAFWLGGTGTAEVQLAPGDTVISAALSSVADGLRELGSGTYSVQVRNSEGVHQFRLVDADGQAVTVKNTSGSGATADWQSVTSGTFNTGRGFSIDFNATGSAGTTEVQYIAKGTSISIDPSSTLKTILTTINSATQPEGHDFKASIVGNQLVLTAAQSGVNHAMIYTDETNLGIGGDLQPAQNAVFTINGVTVSRPGNTNLKDVADGVTLNLAADAEGKAALLSVGADNDKAASLVQTLVDKFNAAFKYLTDKMAVTSKIDGDKTTYTRGLLAGDSVFRSLRTALLDRMNRNYASSGSLRSLSDLGISFDKDLKLTLDAKKFAEAWKSSPTDVNSLLDTALGQMDKTLASFTGSSGSLQNSLTSMDEQAKGFDQRIQTYQKSLNMRQQALINQYVQMQAMLAELGNQAQMFGINLDQSY